MRKWIFIIATIIQLKAMGQETVKHVDVKKYEGKWYVIGFIPTLFDKKWNYTTETYTLNEKGDYDIYTTYKKTATDKIRNVKSKGFIDKTSGNAKWKVQFVWPFKADYWIIELADDYSYTVVGNPKQSFLYIMSRTSTLPDSIYNKLIENCKKKGYDVSKLRRQEQR
ncbi:MAG TPA: lipocalin family protein [Bacteroidia bacterium]|nr:lipocalin family protein [Bacteroidia bacterium]HRG52460.1 lipocalin family protein [Bacteroidia bacterium]